VVAAPAQAAVGRTGATTDSVRGAADWILGAQLSDGAIATYVDRAAISPYIANYAAMGLARASEVTGDPSYAQGAWKWLFWYQANQDSRGFVTDFVVGASGEVSTGDMDSTDAYAGTFLLAAWRTWKATGNTTTLAQLHTSLALAVGAIEATQDGDGLTWAKPSWHVKYLMDQAEAIAGLRSAADLAIQLQDLALASRATLDAAAMQSGVDKLWNPATGAYDWAVQSSGAHNRTNWALLYPDGLEQVWAVAFGLTGGVRAQALMNHFNRVHPLWDQPASADLFSWGQATVGYWPVGGLAMARAGRAVLAATAAKLIEAAAVTANRAWPFTTGVAGNLIELESADYSYLPPIASPA
jgi:hypothetical protein